MLRIAALAGTKTIIAHGRRSETATLVVGVRVIRA